MLKFFTAIILFFLISSIIWRVLSRFYIIPCPSWLGWLIERNNPLSTINHSQTIIQHLDLKHGMKVLDVGCGPGRLTIPMARAVGANGQVFAMDIQKDMLEKVVTKAQKNNLSNIIYVCSGIGEQKLKNSLFDRILLVSVLGEIPNQKNALLEIYNALKPGGILSVTEIIFDPHYQRQANVRREASNVGFKEHAYFSDWLAFTLNFRKPM